MAKRAIEPARFIATARFLDLYEVVVEHLERRSAVVTAARREGWGATTDELQAEADDYRRALGLHRAQAMTAWLATVGYTLDDFEEEMEYRLLLRKKRTLFAAAELERFFQEQRAELERVRISTLLVGTESVARELVEQVNSEGADFAKLAAQHSRDEATRDSGGYVGWVRRRDLAPEVAARVFGTKPGRCAPPIVLHEQSTQVVLVHETRAATLDPGTQEELRDALLAKWLAALTA